MIGILSQQYTLIFTGYNFAGMPIVRFNVMISEFRWKSRFSLKSSTRIGSFMNKWWASGYNRCQMVYRNTGNIRNKVDFIQVDFVKDISILTSIFYVAYSSSRPISSDGNPTFPRERIRVCRGCPSPSTWRMAKRLSWDDRTLRWSLGACTFSWLRRAESKCIRTFRSDERRPGNWRKFVRDARCRRGHVPGGKDRPSRGERCVLFLPESIEVFFYLNFVLCLLKEMKWQLLVCMLTHEFDGRFRHVRCVFQGHLSTWNSSREASSVSYRCLLNLASTFRFTM